MLAWEILTSLQKLAQKQLHRANDRQRLLVGGLTALAVYRLARYLWSRQQRLNLPPHAAYSLPIVGHSLHLLWDADRFIDWCTATYGEVFSIDTFGKTITIASGSAGQEVLKADPDYLSLEEGILRDVLHLHYAIGRTTFEIGFHANPIVARSTISRNKMGQFTDGILEGLDRGLDKLLGDQAVSVIANPSPFLQHLVAHMTVPTLVGKEVAANEHVIQSFAQFTGDITANIPTWMMLPKSFHGLIWPYLQSFHRHRHIMADHVMPVIRARRESLQAGQCVDNTDQTFLQGLIEFQKPDGSYYSDRELSEAVLLIAFASVHTTSINLSFCLYWLIARPDLQSQLLQEIESVVKGPITSNTLDQLTLLDNFVREVLRQGVDKLANGKKALQDFTFSNGYQIPKGQLVESANRQLNMGLHARGSTVEAMDPLLSKNRSSTTPSRDFVTFGLGKHLCPGRFFAVHEIKLSLITLLQRYTITTVSGNKPRPIRYFSGTIAINCEDPLIFTRKNT